MINICSFTVWVACVGRHGSSAPQYLHLVGISTSWNNPTSLFFTLNRALPAITAIHEQTPLKPAIANMEKDELLAFRLQLREAGIDDFEFTNIELRRMVRERREQEPCASAPYPLREESAPPPTFECSICCENCPLEHRFTACNCHDLVCESCMRTQLTLIATETAQFPIRCLVCNATLNPEQCLPILQGNKHVYEKLERLILERRHFEQIRYCANPGCAQPFDWHDDPEMRGYIDAFRVVCPLCRKATCVQCRMEWHVGQTCEQHQQEREATDAFRRFVIDNQLQECPECTNVVEKRAGDCNFVRCRCGCAFCHNCGNKYLSLEMTDDNVHGKPDCTCGLWGRDHVPPQRAVGAEPQPAEQPAEQPQPDEQLDEQPPPVEQVAEQRVEPPPPPAEDGVDEPRRQLNRDGSCIIC